MPTPPRFQLRAPIAPAPLRGGVRPIVTAPLPRAAELTGLARAHALIAEVRQIRERVEGYAHRLGVVLRELATDEMLRHLGCKSFREVLEKHDLGPRVTAFRYMTLAENFTEEETTTLGPEKAYALVQYGKVVEKLPAVILRSDIKIGGHPVAELSVRSIRDLTVRAATKLRAREEADDDSALDANRVVRKLGPKLRSHGAPTAKLRQVRKRGGGYGVRIDLDSDEAMALFETVFGRSR